MAVVYQISPTRTVRRQPSRHWSPAMAEAYARLHPQTRVEHDGEPMVGVQLELFRVHNSMIENASRFTYPS